MTKYNSKYNNESTQFEENEHTQFDEKTQFGNDEHTQFDDNTQANDTPQADGKQAGTQAAAQPKKKPIGKRVAAGAASGLAMGAAWGVLSSGTPADQTGDDTTTEGGEAGEGHEGAEGATVEGEASLSSADTPEWTDGQVPVAHGVSNDMSFTDAFDTARMEVGPGGVFEWHGNIYNTYTKEEWDNMSPAQRHEFGSHFHWNSSASGNNDVEVVDAHHATSASAHHSGASAHHAGASAHATAYHPGQNGDEGPDYIDGGNAQTNGGNAQNEGGNASSDNVVPATAHTDDDGEVEILGVHHDSESGYTYANILLDNHEAVLVDINNDDTFDVLAVDANNDGQLQDNEMLDISSHGITAQSLHIDTQHADTMTASATHQEESVVTSGPADGHVVPTTDTNDDTTPFDDPSANIVDCNNDIDQTGNDVYDL